MPTTLYWTDDNSTIWKWDGSTVTNWVISPYDDIYTLVVGPDRLLVSRYLVNGGVAEVDFDLTTKTNWAQLTWQGEPLIRDPEQSIGVWDAAEGAYWFHLQGESMWLTNSPHRPYWAKVSSSGTVLSVHVNDEGDFLYDPMDPHGANATLVGDYLYWNTSGGALFRYNKATDTTQWLDLYDPARPGASDIWRARVIGAMPDGRLVMTYSKFTPYREYFVIVDVSSAGWAAPTAIAGYIPLFDAEYLAADEGLGLLYGVGTTYAGWAVVSGTTAYFAGEDTVPGEQAIWSMDLTNGALARVCGFVGFSAAIGMVAIGKPNIGQLYVNLSTEQNNPNWVSVCPVDGGKAGHFNMSATTTPDWYLLHQDYFRVNISTTETPDWWEVCTHNN